MLIGIPRETQAGETRVSGTPANVTKLRSLGYDVVVERGAGHLAEYRDADYEAAGATVADAAEVWGAEIVLGVNVPNPDELAMMRADSTLIALLGPRSNPGIVDVLAQHQLTALAMDAVPRISRAQSMDALSSMANIAGYRSVVEAAHQYGGFFTGQVTAAGRIPPAKILVAGAGVAGLAAIGQAVSMGAIVRATDPRPVVADEVKSLGGEYLPVEVVTEQGTDGYAKATSEEYDAAAARLYAEQCRDVDIIITTAQIPGRPAPRLITAEMVASMKTGSVIVDMAADSGGNVEGSVAGEKVVTENGVTILGYSELARRAAKQASQLYGSNLVHLISLFTPEKDGVLQLNESDVIAQQMTVVRDGVVTWPPPPVSVAAAPQVAVADPAVALDASGPAREPLATRRATWVLAGVATAGLLAALAFAPPSFVANLTVFALAVVIGYYVIGNVHHALHTPLMSVTNAVSGIIVLGALVQAPMLSSHPAIGLMALAAVALASINIVGGFTVTHRMLGMFRRS